MIVEILKFTEVIDFETLRIQKWIGHFSSTEKCYKWPLHEKSCNNR